MTLPHPRSRFRATAGRTLSGGVPGGDPATAWGRRRDSYRLVSPGNRPRFPVIVVGTGLAGSGAAAALAELGFRVTVFTYHDAPRRAHSVAAQGGINAARARRVDGDLCPLRLRHRQGRIFAGARRRPSDSVRNRSG